ncbi:MAG TPA: hypothetical protein VJT31_03290 [Rugosimonospora sp.]|nr:hypothetical protein [Rugosimonospora sp.]
MTTFDPRRLNMFAAPLEASDWQSEQLSWKESCFLHGGLSVMPSFRLRGPDVVRMFNDIAVNNVGRLRVGASTHLIMCSEQGRILGHGVLVREDEDTYRTHVHAMHVRYPLASGRYDVTAEELTGTRFHYQVGGPRSLEVVESALGEDLHDIRFLRHRPVKATRLALTGGPVEVLRLGMCGTLAYEIHGNVADAPAVYEALMAAGQPVGIRVLGTLVYMNTLHTETGFPNEYIHFLPAFGDDPGMLEFLRAEGLLMVPESMGSAGPDPSASYVTPYDVGWGHMVKFDHDFKGRAALEALAADPPRRLVTLEWNTDDVLGTARSLFGPDEAAYPLMRMPADDRIQGGTARIYNDLVRRDGRTVGMSMGRMYSWYYRTMLSLAPVDVAHAEIGTELTVLWGAPGTRQREIRATVRRYPYLDLPRNEKIDVSEIPGLAAESAVS